MPRNSKNVKRHIRMVLFYWKRKTFSMQCNIFFICN